MVCDFVGMIPEVWTKAVSGSKYACKVKGSMKYSESSTFVNVVVLPLLSDDSALDDDEDVDSEVEEAVPESVPIMDDSPDDDVSVLCEFKVSVEEELELLTIKSVGGGKWISASISIFRMTSRR
jgi:hypothetical protein